jgi:hypothetical protein
LRFLADLFQTKTRKSEIEFDEISDQTYLNEPLKTKIIDYCIIDCKVLYELVEEYYKLLGQIRYKDKVYNGLPMTTANMSLDVFQQLFIPLKLEITGSPREIYEIERESYYGGFVNVFKKYGTNLHYYDINSSYPFSMSGKNGKYGIPFALKSVKIFSTSPILIEINGKKELYGNSEFEINPDALYKIKWKFKKELRCPYFAVRTNEGLLYPIEGIEADWRWGELIILGLKYDLFEELMVKEEIVYHTRKDVFSEYVSYFYERKNETKKSGDKTMNYFYKLLLNSLYGKFGQRQFDQQYYVTFSRSREFFNHPYAQMKLLDDDLIKITIPHQKNVDGLFSCVRIASRITASSLATLVEAIFTLDPDPIEASKHVYYVDTDSITCDRELSAEWCDEEKLGYFKKEYDIKEAWFVSAKNYLLRYEVDHLMKTELKMKGVNSDNYKLNPMEFFTNFLTKGEVKVTNQNIFKRKYNGVSLVNLEKTIVKRNKRRQEIEGTNETLPYKNVISYYKKHKPTGKHITSAINKWHMLEEEGEEDQGFNIINGEGLQEHHVAVVKAEREKHQELDVVGDIDVEEQEIISRK